VYLKLTRRLRDALAGHIREKYGVELTVVLERPPKIEMGEAASPVSFELAKRLKKAPRIIAQEIANGIGKIAGIARIEVAGAGYLNAYFDRGAFWNAAQKEAERRGAEGVEKSEKVIVEHTSINPNKAAHVGHVRNAVLGDTMARILRHSGERVQVQNYIDNTGVQVADVVIGLLHMKKLTPVWVMNRVKEPKFDYFCWDLYAEATQYFAEDKERAAKLRGATLKAIEEGRGEEAEVGQVVADAIVSCHLRTMVRLGIVYDLLARESEILHLKFWDAAFAMLKEAGAIEFVESGKMAGCWVMRWKEEVKEVKEAKEVKEKPAQIASLGQQVGAADSSSVTSSTSLASNPEDISQDKIIVRSNGTVTYVGKDIAYQLWKFGLLGKDFRYRRWSDAPEGEEVWATTSEAGEAGAPPFGERAAIVYNVIDSRQAYLQEVVAEGLRGLGHAQEAARSIHFSYDIVALTPRCAHELGYELSEEEAKKPYVEVSGRKGFGVKADDLIDKLEAAALSEIEKRHSTEVDTIIPAGGWTDFERKSTSHIIAVGALRFFLLKFTRNTIIAFDFEDALSFEGETGPYCQYAVVRARGIWRRGAAASPDMTSDAAVREAAATLRVVDPTVARQFLEGAENNGLWELLLQAGSLDSAMDAVIGAQEPAFAAKYAFQLAQAFNNFYHKHHILSEADEQKRAFLLALTELVEKQLVRALELLGIEAPEKM